MSLVLGLERGVKGDALGRPAFRRLPLTPSEAPKNGKEGCGTVVLQPSDCKFSFSRRPSGATARGTGREGRNTIGGAAMPERRRHYDPPPYGVPCSSIFTRFEKWLWNAGLKAVHLLEQGFEVSDLVPVNCRPRRGQNGAPEGGDLFLSMPLKRSPRRGRPALSNKTYKKIPARS